MATIYLNGKKLKPSTKKELAERIVNHRAWDGEKSVNLLCRRYYKYELKEMLSDMRYM